MKHLLFGLLFVLFIGCSATRYSIEVVDDNSQSKPMERVFPYDFDTVWNCAVEEVTTFPLTVVEKESGVISTGWYDEMQTKNVLISRGVGYGGRVSDVMPIEVREHLNILISSANPTSTTVKIVKVSKIRPYQMVVGPKGLWTPDKNADFVSGKSNTNVESRILDGIQKCLSQ
jgi:hypothetical protein